MHFIAAVVEMQCSYIFIDWELEVQIKNKLKGKVFLGICKGSMTRNKQLFQRPNQNSKL